ncbi:GroES-like protein [Myriangium duriaei CBS 260.36]|uniref:GroES-like protein n=1 Tax=Myriangium duriaei CBS 260.36 TaxID=1168546 RepID=A0A9P4J1E6_9PEZI|nr:GroES-like protein [Myriangium duriaei CBS 260.36]
MPTQTEAYVSPSPAEPVQLRRIELVDPGEGEVLVEVVACSICATDIKAAEGHFLLAPPLILGHEGSGIVREVGHNVAGFQPGDKVVMTFASCRQCRHCIASRPSYCTQVGSLNFDGRRQDGSYVASMVTEGKPLAPLNALFFGQSSLARHVLAHATSLVKLEDNTTVEDLRSITAMGCGFQTGAGAVLNVAQPPPGSRIAVIGAGSVGLAAALAALLTDPAQILLVDNDGRKFARLPACLSSVNHKSSNVSVNPLTEVLRRVTDDQGADFILDCVGAASLIEAAIPALAIRGTVITVGGGPPNARASIRPLDMLRSGIAWRGTHQGDSDPREFIPLLIRLQKEGKLRLDQLLSFYDFDKLHAALNDLKEGKVYKPVLVVR